MSHLTSITSHRRIALGVAALAALSLVPLAAQAWGRGGHRGPSPERAVERLTEELSLTADQQSQVKTIMEENFAKGAEMRQTHRKEMDALRDETHESLAAVLSPEQVQKFDQLREERRDHREHRQDCDRRPCRWGDGPDRKD